jgi:hypothetical protein
MGAKRIMIVAALAIGLGGLGAGATQAADGHGASKPKKAQDDPSRRVCRNIVPSGSRLSTRVCRTQQQWDESRDKAQDGVLQHQMGPGTTYEQVPG